MYPINAFYMIVSGEKRMSLIKGIFSHDVEKPDDDQQENYSIRHLPHPSPIRQWSVLTRGVIYNTFSSLIPYFDFA